MKKRIRFIVSARMLVLRGRKILMGFEPPHKYGLGGNHWETPGGGIEKMETVMEGLKREAKEEIGAEIEFKNILPFFFKHTPKRVTKKNHHGVMIYFICNLLTESNLKKASDKEFNEIRFLGKEDFLKLSNQNMVMSFDNKFIPIIMKKLKLW